MFAGEDIAFSGLEVCSYRHLQKAAKGMGLPCNVKKVNLIEMIRAKKYSSEDVLNAIISRIKNERKVNADIKKKKKKLKERTFNLQGAEISSTSNSHSPPISLTPKRPVHFSFQYSPEHGSEEQPIVKIQPRNILRTSTSIMHPIKSITSDRVLRSFKTNSKPNYRIMNERNCVVSVVRAQSTLQHGRSEKTFQSVTIKHPARMTHLSQLPPVSRVSNSLKPAKRQRQISGIYPLTSQDQPFYRYAHDVGFRRDDGKVARINAVIHKQPQNLLARNPIRAPIQMTLQDVINYRVDQTDTSQAHRLSEQSRMYNANKHNERKQVCNRTYSYAKKHPISYQVEYQRFNDAMGNQIDTTTRVTDKTSLAIDQGEGCQLPIESNCEVVVKRMEFAELNKTYPANYTEVISNQANGNSALYKDNSVLLSRLENQEIDRKEKVECSRHIYEKRDNNQRIEYIEELNGNCYNSDKELDTDYSQYVNGECKQHQDIDITILNENIGMAVQNKELKELDAIPRQKKELPNDLHSQDEEMSARYPNMSALPDEFPENDIESFSVYYHKKIRGEVRRKSREAEILPRINDAFTQFNKSPSQGNTTFENLHNPLAPDREISLKVPLPIMISSNTCMLEHLYNFKNQFVTNTPLIPIKATQTFCTYSTKTITTAVASPVPADITNISNQYERGSVYPRDYMSSKNQSRTFGSDEVLSSSTLSIDTDAQELGANVTIPEMVEDALELISQDGDYMERIGMDIRVQCILCMWAGPFILLENHVKEDHAQEIQEEDNKDWTVLLTLGSLVSRQTWRCQLVQHAGSVYVLSTKYGDTDTLMVALSVIPSEKETLKNFRITVYNKISGKPFSFESEVAYIPMSMPYEYPQDCLVVDIGSLDLIPNSVNLKLVNRELVVSPPSKAVVGQPLLDNVEIIVHVKLF